MKDQFCPLSKYLLLIMLFLGVQNLLLLRNSHFFRPEITMELGGKIKGTYPSCNNAHIYIHFILKEKQQGYVFVLHRFFLLFFKFFNIKTLDLSVLEHGKLGLIGL